VSDQAGHPSWFGGGDPRPLKTAPLGMTTLRVSADFLDLKAAPPLPGPSLGEGEDSFTSALTLLFRHLGPTHSSPLSAPRHSLLPFYFIFYLFRHSTNLEVNITL